MDNLKKAHEVMFDLLNEERIFSVSVLCNCAQIASRTIYPTGWHKKILSALEDATVKSVGKIGHNLMSGTFMGSGLKKDNIQKAVDRLVKMATDKQERGVLPNTFSPNEFRKDISGLFVALVDLTSISETD